MTESLREIYMIYVLNDLADFHFFSGVLHLFAFKRTCYPNLVFKNCGVQEVKLGKANS